MSKLWLFLIIFVNINIYTFVHGQDFISKNPKVVAGSRAVQSQYPFVVSVIPVLKSGGGAVSCTGVIVTDKWVITTAHCLNKNDDVDGAIVRAAVMDSKQGSPNTQDRRSTNIVIHEGTPKGGKNSWDVALLEISEPFVFDEYVKSITLAKKPLPTTTMTCVAIGYGFTTQAGANSNSYLYSLPTRAGDNKYCNKKNPNRVVGEEYVCLVPDSDNQAMSSSVTGGPLVCGGLLVGVRHGTENNEGEVVDNCVGENCTQVYIFPGYLEPWIRERVANIPDFQPLVEANLINVHPEYDLAAGQSCIPCAKVKEFEKMEAAVFKTCGEETGCKNAEFNAAKPDEVYFLPGKHADCKEDCNKGDKGGGSTGESTTKKSGTIKTTFSCFTIGMLMMIALLFN